MSFKNTLKTLLPLVALIAVSSCQAETKDVPPVQYKNVAADISISVTNDFETPSPIIKATFVPNVIAGWASQAVFIDKNGALLRTQMDKPQPKAFSEGPFTDIQGLGRKGQAGLLLALTPSGKVEAFIEMSDDGAFEKISVAAPDLKIKYFCQTSDFLTPVLRAKTLNNQTILLDISIKNTSTLSLTRTHTLSETDCLRETVLLSPEQSLTPNPTGPHLILNTSEGKKFLEIKDGLSIRGIKNPDLILMTPTNLGGTFNQGALLVTNTNSPRIVMIARDYLIDVLNTSQ